MSVYTASKAAVNAFTEVLALELAPFDVRVRLVLPGRSPEIKFSQNARARVQGIPDAYAELAQSIFAKWANSSDPVTHGADVAEAIWRAVTDPSCPLRLPAGADAIQWAKAG